MTESDRSIYDTEHIFAVGLRSDDLRGFISSWDGVLVNLSAAAKPADNILETLFLRQIRKSKRMEVDIAHYDRLPPGHHDRCYEYLHRCVNATIERDRLAWMRTEASRSIGGDHGPAAGAVKGGGKGGQKSGKTGDKGKGKVKGDKKGSKGSARRDTSTDSRSDKKEVCKKHLVGNAPYLTIRVHEDTTNLVCSSGRRADARTVKIVSTLTSKPPGQRPVRRKQLLAMSQTQLTERRKRKKVEDAAAAAGNERRRPRKERPAPLRPLRW